MSRFKLYTKEKKIYQYLTIGLVTALCIGAAGYGIHAIGTARAKSRETVLIYTEEEFEQYLTDRESEEYNLDGRYRLEEDLDLSWLEYSIGTNIEPFTESFDGNGHVVSGLERPLFGVMKRAEVENLFLSEAVITRPFTYSDGERYVDGYGALAAYAVDSVIRNCGMSGEIYTASPSEAEYQLAKASPADAFERGPGTEGPGAEGPGMEEEKTVESSPVPEDEGAGGGPGVETGWESDAETGPGGEHTDTSTGTGEINTDTGTGEISTDTGTGEISTDTGTGETSTDTGTGSGDENTDVSSGTSGESGDDGSGDAVEPGPDVESPDESGTGESLKPSEEAGSFPAENEDESGRENSTSEAGGETGRETTAVSGGETGGTDQERQEAGGNAASLPTQGENGDVTKEESSAFRTVSSVQALYETIGFQSNNRQQLMMKVPAVADSGMGELLTASPSDATPPDAQEAPDESRSENGTGNGIIEGTVNDPVKEPEYIGNPEGDIYILVTAEQITAGGLIAQTAGETLISDSFALVTIGSDLEGIDTYTGGLTGILGTDCRTENSYAAGLSDSTGINGGFAAVNEGIIENSYAAVTIGKAGTRRGAFTAMESGQLSGCVYDRQIACAGGEETEYIEDVENIEKASPSEIVEFHLIGMKTSDMTGTESRIPGTWRKTENAYPQLEYFSLHENEIAAASSRASVIALELPGELTLADVVKNGDIVLPSEIDGKEIIWEAEGNIRIDEKNQVVSDEIGAGSTDETVTISPEGSTVSFQEQTVPTIEPKEVPIVGSSLEKISGPDVKDFDESRDTERRSDGGTSQLKASVGSVTRNFAISAVATETSTAAYADWGAVGEAIYNGTVTGTDFIPVLNTDGYYEIKTPEALAWFGYMVNHIAGNGNINGMLMNDIDLSGFENNWATSTPLEWMPIGETELTQYGGVFDGRKHTISNLKMDGSSKALFGNIKDVELRNIILSQVDIQGGGTAGIASRIRGSYVVTGCGVESGTIKSISAVGGVLGETVGTANGIVTDCYNKASIIITVPGEGHVAGGVFAAARAGSLTMERCYNLGAIDSPSSYYDSHGAGILAYGFAKIKIDSCYNAGKIINNSTYGFAGGITAKTVMKSGTVTNSYNLSGMGNYTTNNGRQLSEKAMKSWALPYALNGQSMDGVWACIPGEYPGFGTLARPESWQDVGQGVIDGLVTGVTLAKDSATGAYHIGSAEQLATFASRVNAGTADFLSGNIKLIMDINLAGERYGGTIASPIPWIPIGDETNVYQGTFDGGGKAIGHMKVEQDGYAGFFGCAGGGAVITGVGLDSSCKVTSTGTASGDGTAALVGMVKSNETAVRQIMIQNCYSRATVTSAGTASTTGAFVGNYSGTPGGSEKISNCYNTGMIKVSGGSAGAVAGTFFHANDSGIKNCYWDSETSGSVLAAVIAGGATVENCSGKTTAAMKSDDPSEILDPLNANLGTGTWYRVDKRNDGYPIFMKSESEVTWEDVGAAVMAPRSKNSSSTPGTEGDPYQIWTAEELAWFAYQVNNVSGQTGLCAELMADINLFGGLYSGHAYDPNADGYLSKALLWVAIGESPGGSSKYFGTFHGNGHTVSGMRVGSTTASYQGMFGVIGDNTEIASLTVGECQIVGKEYIGGIAGFISGSGITIKDCKFTGKISGDGSWVGGIAGLIRGTETAITRCRNSGEIECTDYVGGIAGEIDAGGSGELTITECWNSGNVTGENASGTGGVSGGIAGAGNVSSGRVVLDGCYNSGSVSSGMPGSYGANAGGIIGLDYRSGGNTGTLTVRNCYNQGTVYGNSGTSSYNHSIGGIAGGLTNLSEVKGCYNTGQLTGAGSQFRSIAGSNDGTGNITNCYYQIGGPADPSAKEVSEAGLKTWGAAFALNGGQLSQSTGISWSYTEGNYPVPSQITLRDAASWEEVGEAVYYGLLDGAAAGSPYQIGTAEQLAEFAYRVNRVTGNSRVNADLTADIDMTATENSYISSGRLPWVPIGKNGAPVYQGTFQSQKLSGIQHIYQIRNMYVSEEGAAGLFGTISGGTVSGIGIVNADVTGKRAAGLEGTAGGIAGRLDSGGIISRCYNRGGSHVTADGLLTAYAGGIAGELNAGSTIKDCYNMDSVISSVGDSGNCAGGIAGIAFSSKVQNSYHASGSSGGITVSGGSDVGSVMGSTAFNGIIERCYSDVSLSDRNVVKTLGTADDTVRQKQVDELNTETTASGDVERKRSDRAWFTSLASEDTRGLPTLEAPQTITFTLNPADTNAGNTQSFTPEITSAGLRGIRQETGSSPVFRLTPADEVGDHFSTYGSTNANQCLGLVAGSTDLKTLTPSLLAPAAGMGNVSQLTLYTGAAYTLATDRVILIDLSDTAGRRYEIRVTIPGVTGKTLSVELPSNVTVDLSPDGTLHTDLSSDVSIINRGNYPVEGGILSLTQVTGSGYVPLKPVQKLSQLNKDNWITDTGGGVRLGIVEASTDPSGLIPAEGLYYDPASPTAWMNCRLKGNGSFRYRYAVQYTAYFNFWENQYGFDVNYKFQVAEQDFTAQAGEVELTN